MVSVPLKLLFTLEVDFKDQHVKKVQDLEKDGSILFGGLEKNSETEYIVFNCRDETLPYDFIKSVFFYLVDLNYRTHTI